MINIKTMTSFVDKPRFSNTQIAAKVFSKHIGMVSLSYFENQILTLDRCDPNYRHNPTLCTGVKDRVSNEYPCLGYEYTSPPQRLRQTTPLPPQDTSTTQNNSQQTFSNTSTAFTVTTSTYNRKLVSS